MKTLVTGANGHIGSNIVKLLLEAGREVRALVRETSDLRSLDGLDVELVKGDVLDGESLKKAVKGCPVIYHTAAVYAIWSTKAEEILAPAIEGSKNLFGALEGRSVDKVVYTSSIAAVGFGASPDRLLTAEDWNAHPSNPYIKAKTEAEQWVHRWVEGKDVPVVYTLPSVVLGPGDYKPTPSNRIVLMYLNGLPGLHIKGGINVSDVREVARGHLLAEAKGVPGERYLLGGENLAFRDLYRLMATVSRRWLRTRLWVPTSLKGVATTGVALQERLFRIAKMPPIVSRSEMEEFFGGYAYYDIRPTAEALGLEIRPAEETLRDAVQWLKEVGMVRPWASLLTRGGGG